MSDVPPISDDLLDRTNGRSMSRAEAALIAIATTYGWEVHSHDRSRMFLTKDSGDDERQQRPWGSPPTTTGHVTVYLSEEGYILAWEEHFWLNGNREERDEFHRGSADGLFGVLANTAVFAQRRGDS